jgi:hypothetical protein
MKQHKPLVSDVVSLRALEYSKDGKNVTVSLSTKYSSERFFSVPLTCLAELITDLENLKGAMPKAAAPQPPVTPVEARPTSAPAANTAGNEVKVKVPKKWMLASGLPNHPLIILVLDPQTSEQTGYGFGDKAARELATGLVKYADLVSKTFPDGAKPKPPAA